MDSSKPCGLLYFRAWFCDIRWLGRKRLKAYLSTNGYVQVRYRKSTLKRPPFAQPAGLKKMPFLGHFSLVSSPWSVFKDFQNFTSQMTSEYETRINRFYRYVCICIHTCTQVWIHIYLGRDVYRCWLREINLADRYQLSAISAFGVRNPTRTGSVLLCLRKRDFSQHTLQPCTWIVRRPEQHFFIIIQTLMSYNRKVVGVVRLSSPAFTTIFKSFALTKLFQIAVSAVKLKSFVCSVNMELLTCTSVNTELLTCISHAWEPADEIVTDLPQNKRPGRKFALCGGFEKVCSA